MIHAMWNTKISGAARLDDEMPSEAELLRELDRRLRQRLPDAWQVVGAAEPRPAGGRRVDAELTIAAPDGTTAQVVVEVKRRVDPIEVPQLAEQLRQYATEGAVPLVIAPFLSERTRGALAERGIGYADATGNLLLTLDRPAVYIETTGAKANPWRETRQLQSLKGRAAGRIVRALVDFRPPYGIRELAERSQNSVASVVRVVALLEREALLTRGVNGEVTGTKWAELIRRWTQDYDFATSNRIARYLEPRGIEALVGKLADGSSQPYAVTGSLAAVRVAPIAPPRLATVYVGDLDAAAERLNLRKAERGVNVILAEPFDSVVFERTAEQGGVTYAAVSQVAADLLTGPGRSPQEGDELLRWMEENEDAWRR